MVERFRIISRFELRVRFRKLVFDNGATDLVNRGILSLRISAQSASHPRRVLFCSAPQYGAATVCTTHRQTDRTASRSPSLRGIRVTSAQSASGFVFVPLLNGVAAVCSTDRQTNRTASHPPVSAESASHPRNPRRVLFFWFQVPPRTP